MSTITQLTTVPADLIGAQTLRPGKPVESEQKPAKQASKPTADNDVRLVIQEGSHVGIFIYTILDRASGRVMAQIPHVDVEALAARPDYEAGQVINTTA